MRLKETTRFVSNIIKLIYPGNLVGRRQWHHVNLSHSFELSLKFSQNSVDRKQIDLVLREHFFSNFSILWKFHVVKTRRYASCLFRDHVVVFRFVNFIEREQNLYDFLILWKFHVVETRRYASRLFRDHIVVLSICEFYSDNKGWYWAQNAQQYSEENIVRIEKWIRIRWFRVVAIIIAFRVCLICFIYSTISGPCCKSTNLVQQYFWFT